MLFEVALFLYLLCCYIMMIVGHTHYTTQFNFLGKKYIGGNWCGQTWIVSLLSNFKYQNSLQLINEKVLFVFYLLTLCNCLLILWEFLSWKNFFWHGPSISWRLTSKTHFLIVYQFYLHHFEIDGPSQTQSII